MRLLGPGPAVGQVWGGERCVWVTCVVGVHTHADVALGEGKRQGGLWLPAGLESEFPLWLGLISPLLTFLGDPRWFLPSLGRGPLWRETHAGGGKGVEASTDAMGPERFCWASGPPAFLRLQLCSVLTAYVQSASQTALSTGNVITPTVLPPSSHGQAMSFSILISLTREPGPRESK